MDHPRRQRRKEEEREEEKENEEKKEEEEEGRGGGRAGGEGGREENPSFVKRCQCLKLSAAHFNNNNINIKGWLGMPALMQS